MSLFKNDTVTIARRTQNKLDITTTPVWTGMADFQLRSGQQYVDPAGVVNPIGAVVFIDPVNGQLPVVNPKTDIVQYNGQDFTIMLAHPFASPAAHLELWLRFGPIKYQGPA